MAGFTRVSQLISDWLAVNQMGKNVGIMAESNVTWWPNTSRTVEKWYAVNDNYYTTYSQSFQSWRMINTTVGGKKTCAKFFAKQMKQIKVIVLMQYTLTVT